MCALPRRHAPPTTVLASTMQYMRGLGSIASAIVCCAGCSSKDDSTAVQAPSSKTVLDLSAVKTTPAAYDWFDFRPNVKKLILSGAAETEHVAILWYTVADGSVGLHYHSKTESVFVIDGTQTDAKGVYPTGTVYFNPPGSGHAIAQSSGFFVLAYASPPDFAKTDAIGEYTPVRIDTTDPGFMDAHPFERKRAGVQTFDARLDAAGGLSAQFIELSASANDYEYSGNYLLVLDGRCDLDGQTFGKETLVVTRAVAPEPFKVGAAPGAVCRAMGVSF